MLNLCLALVIGFLPGLQESTDKRELRYRLEKGRVLEIRMEQKMSLKLKEIPVEFEEMIGDEPLKLDFTGTIVATVSAVDEKGTATLTGKFTKASATGTVFVEDVEFEYDAENPDALEEDDNEGGNPLGLDPASMFRQLVTETLTFEIDSLGRMTQKNVTEENRLPFQISSLNGMMGPLPREKVGTGDRWKSKERISLPGMEQVQINLRAENTVEKFTKVGDEDCVVIRTKFRVATAGDEGAEVEPGDGMFEFEAKMTGGGAGTTTFSISTGRPKTSSCKIDVNIAASMANPQGDDDLEFKALFRISQKFQVR